MTGLQTVRVAGLNSRPAAICKPAAKSSVLSLADAAKLLPKRHRGKKVSTSCIFRWGTVGCRGVILESIQVGGTRCTSKEALTRFFTRLSEATRAHIVPEALVTEADREKQIEAANAELDRAGF